MKTTIQLYNSQKDRCDQQRIKLMSKRTDIEHTRRVGFIIGPNTKVVSPQ